MTVLVLEKQEQRHIFLQILIDAYLISEILLMPVPTFVLCYYEKGNHQYSVPHFYYTAISMTMTSTTSLSDMYCFVKTF